MTLSEHLRRRVDAQLAAQVGVHAHDLHHPGVHLAPTTWEWDDVMVLLLAESAWAAGPVHLMTSLGNRVTHLSREEAGSAHVWRTLVDGAQVVGPSMHAYTEHPAGVDTTGVTEATEEELAGLQDAVPADEWVEGGFAGHDVTARFAYTDPDSRQVLAAANLTPWDEHDADVGVVVHPGARGRGLATVVAAAATDRAVDTQGAARWRALADNAASLAVGRRLGFRPYGASLVVIPAPRTQGTHDR